MSTLHQRRRVNESIPCITGLNYPQGVAVSKSREVVVVTRYLDGDITMSKKERIRLLNMASLPRALPSLATMTSSLPILSDIKSNVHVRE